MKMVETVDIENKIAEIRTELGHLSIKRSGARFSLKATINNREDLYTGKIEELYEGLGLLFSNYVKRNLEEARNFQNEIVKFKQKLHSKAIKSRREQVARLEQQSLVLEKELEELENKLKGV